ncbi:hypothetical protein F4808DRAFT_426164 [Astrocystis sublimbata]|nr:hypothetical protein F4808DRAFT_426164 [Astrocystis sublimbata]
MIYGLCINTCLILFVAIHTNVDASVNQENLSICRTSLDDSSQARLGELCQYRSALTQCPWNDLRRIGTHARKLKGVMKVNHDSVVRT